MAQDYDVKTIAAMQTGDPVSTYKKTIRAKLFVSVLDERFTGKVEGLILVGDDNDPRSMYDTWTEKEDAYFRNANRAHFLAGKLIKITRVKEEGPKPIEQYTDDELRDVVNSPYLAFKKILSELKSETTVQRILTIARNEEKSEKFVNNIIAKISQLQGVK